MMKLKIRQFYPLTLLAAFTIFTCLLAGCGATTGTGTTTGDVSESREVPPPPPREEPETVTDESESAAMTTGARIDIIAKNNILRSTLLIFIPLKSVVNKAG